MLYVYTDGSFFGKGNNLPSGWAFVVLQVDNDNYEPKDIYWNREIKYEIFYNNGVELNSGGNNRAELIAIMESLIFLTDQTPFEDDIIIRTDSEGAFLSFVGINYNKRFDYIDYGDSKVGLWKSNGWKKTNGSTLRDQDLLKECTILIENFVKAGYLIGIEHIRSHKGEPGNERADFLAKSALSIYKKEHPEDFYDSDDDSVDDSDDDSDDYWDFFKNYDEDTDNDD